MMLPVMSRENKVFISFLKGQAMKGGRKVRKGKERKLRKLKREILHLFFALLIYCTYLLKALLKVDVNMSLTNSTI